MPSAYTPSRLDLEPGPCQTRSLLELESAAALLGDAAVLGTELSFELRSHPSGVGGEPWIKATFVRLQAMLVAERWLIEFLTGPSTTSKGQRRLHADDICIDCFVNNWRFPTGDLANELIARLGPINKLAAHPTWSQITMPPRQWTLTRVENCVDGLAIFADASRSEHPTVASVLATHIDEARSRFQGLPHTVPE